MSEQIDLFENVLPKFHIGKRKVRMIELFAGIGSQYLAMKRIGANVESWRVVEWDKYAIASYNAIHGTNYKPTDICNVKGGDLGITDKDEYVYVLTYSFP